jgi:hypothetical protein
MRTTRIFAASLMILLAVGAASADFKVVQSYHQDGFSMMGQSQPATDENRITWLGENRMRMDQGDTSTIVVLDAKKMFILDHGKKIYYEIDLPIDLASMMPPGMGEQMLNMMKFDVSITPAEETKEVGEWNAKRYDMKMTSAMMSIDAVLWASTEAPIDLKDYAGLYAEVMSLQPGMADMAEKMGQIDGYVVAQDSTMTMSMMGETSIASNEQVTSIEEMDAPAGTYGPPADYAKEEFDYMKMMQNQ